MNRMIHILLLLLASISTVIAQEIEPEPFDEGEYEGGMRVMRDYLENLERHGITAENIRDAWLAGRELRTKAGGPRLLSTPWEFLGPRNKGGRMTGLGVSTQDTNVWYAAADGGGIWKSTVSGRTWTPIGDTLPSLKIRSLAVSPHDDRLVLAGTYEGLVYRTDDGGSTWAVLTPPKNTGSINDIQFDPVQKDVAMLCGGAGVYYSSDAGVTWMLSSAGVASMVAFNPENSSIIYCGQHDGAGFAHIRRTTNGGITWDDVLKRAADQYNVVGVRLCASHPRVVYALIESESKIYRSGDGGDTWSPLAAQPVRNGYHRGFYVFDVDPFDSNIVAAGTTSLFRTTNGGASWDAGDTVNRDLHVDQHAILFPRSMPGRLIVGNDGGVYSSNTYKNTYVDWSDRNRDLVTLEIYNCALHPANVDTLIVGCQDNGYDKYMGNQYNWLIVDGDGFCTLYDQEQPRYFYHEYIYMNLHRADDGFTRWSPKKMRGMSTDSSGNGFYSGIAQPERADWYGQAVAMSPADSKVLYAGTNFLYRTSNRAENWARVSEQEYGSGGDFITAIAIAPTDAHTLYLGTANGMGYRVSDAGAVESINITPSGGFNGRVSSITVSPTNPQFVFAAGDGGFNLQGVRRSTDGGGTWQTCSRGLPRASVSRIVFDPDSAATLYCGTTSGMFFTRDAGDHWYPMPGIPNVAVWDFSFHKSTRTLLIGTYGRGAIRAKGFVPPEVPTGPASVEAAEGSASGELRVLTRQNDGGVIVHLANPVTERVTVRMYDALGRLAASIHDDLLPAGEHEFALGADALNSGAYFIEVSGGHIHLSRACLIAR